MYNAGTYLGSGLVGGINSKKTAAYNAGYALGRAAVKGEKDGQKSNSPSKETIKAGKWLGEGLVIGIKAFASKVYNSGRDLGRAATASISSSVSKITDMLNNDMDTQPAIRPVIDLSDVESGTNAINSMLKMGSTIGMSANVGIISSRMNQRNQNGINSEVVSAIDKLRKDLGNVGNTSYNVNGITYDDGSNMAELVKGIIREARIQRRV